MNTQGWLKALLAAATLALFAGLFLQLDPFRDFDQAPPPPEDLTFERVRLNDSGFVVNVRASGAAPIVIAQIMVDGAFWHFDLQPQGPIERFATAELTIPYPWVAGETHHLTLLSGLGTTFDHTVDVAAASPTTSGVLLLHYAVLGIFVGLVPVALGMLFFPAMKSLGADGLEFLLALTLGLLAYLFVDMTLEGLELSAKASALFGGAALVFLPMALTTAVLLAASNRTRARLEPIALASLVALGIGLHNFGEGLAIGASFASNELALGAFLVIGFTLHNTTEGIAIVSPLVRQQASFARLALLAMIAGLPVIAGIWFGALAFSAHWAAAFFGIGAGAVAQVMVEIDRSLVNHRAEHGIDSRFTTTSVAGYAAGLAIMYTTALLITL